MIARFAAETLGVPWKISSCTRRTPIHAVRHGAYASSTTYITGGATKKAAEQIREQINEWRLTCSIRAMGRPSAAQRSSYSGKQLPPVSQADVVLHDRKAIAPDGRNISLQQIALYATHQDNQHQIMAIASHELRFAPPSARSSPR